MRLLVREVAEASGIRLADLQRSANLSPGMARRYWYSSVTGLQKDAGTLNEIKMDVLERIAKALEIAPGELILGD